MTRVYLFVVIGASVTATAVWQASGSTEWGVATWSALWTIFGIVRYGHITKEAKP